MPCRRTTSRHGRAPCPMAMQATDQTATVKKKLSILDLLGHALGVVGLSMDDFCRLSPEEFDAVCHAHRGHRQAAYRDGWERTRLLATICVQPHTRKKITPQALLPFEWDKQKPKGKILAKEEDKKRLERLVRKKKS